VFERVSRAQAAQAGEKATEEKYNAEAPEFGRGRRREGTIYLAPIGARTEAGMGVVRHEEVGLLRSK
jgi:hypothetical protein